MPFRSGFATVDTSGHWLFFIALTGSATASLCFVTPAVQHRLLFRTGLKEKIVHRANELGLAGAAAPATCWLWLLQPIIDLRRQATATQRQAADEVE
ncbi:DUF6328 family protein [Actinomadura sp. ATCC 39365]